MMEEFRVLERKLIILSTKVSFKMIFITAMEDIFILMEITVNSYDEFEKLTQAKDIRIADALYNAIISNISTKKRSIPFLSVHILEDEKIVDLTVERPYFSDTLEELLPTFIEYERYEECKIIKETIEKLKK
jgi:hypothetical protein